MKKGKVTLFRLPIEPLTQSPRRIWAYLPASYHPDGGPYPVLYMFDGHNLFDDRIATYGKSWGFREYLDHTGLDLVVIGQDCNHTGNRRIDEYCPFPPDRVRGWEGTVCLGNITAEWFVHVLKPYCEKKFRICSDRRHCAVAGSSMGGLMADYMAVRYSSIFGGFAAVSPAMEFAYEKCLAAVTEGSVEADTRIYRSYGTSEIRNRKRQMETLDRLITISNAFSLHGCLVQNRIHVGALHQEAAWEQLVPEILSFLFPDVHVSHQSTSLPR